MKTYIAPSMKIADMASEQMFLIHSYFAAEVKEFKNDEELWDEVEVTLEQSTGIPSKTTSVWSKEW